MKFAITQGIKLPTEPYNQMEFSVTVEFTHRDAGLSDEQLENLSQAQIDVLWSDLKSRVKDEVKGELESFLAQAREASRVENIATRLPANQLTKRTDDASNPSPNRPASRRLRRAGGGTSPEPASSRARRGR